MSSKKIIAIVGATEEKGIDLFHKTAKSESRFLLVSGEKEKLGTLINEYAISHPHTETEVSDCVKNGCWEADIIIIAVSDFDEEERFGLMKEVATQKIVVTLSDNYDYIKKIHQKLPFSKLVNVDSSNAENLIIQGEDEEAVREIRTIFSAAAINELHK
ncbi:MAG: hypothetical protein ABIW47_02045 [Ginsengibacter sp.]|jgi:hypothetical protein